MKTVKTIMLSTAMAVALTACNDDDNNDNSANVTNASSSYLRVFHASPDAPKVNVWLDGAIALPNVDYQQSSGQIPVPSGSHTVQVDAILADGTTTTVIPETALDLIADKEYNVIAAGKVGDNSFGPQFAIRDYLMPMEARVQVMHAAPDAPTVDVFITAPGADLSSASPFADDAAFLAVTDAIEVPAGSYQVRITDPSDSNMVFFDSGTIAVPAGADWFVAATNNTLAGESPVALLVDTGASSLIVQDINSGAEIRVVHTISDAPGVDVWVDGVAPVSSSPLFNLMYQDKTDYLPLAAQETEFAVAVNGSNPVTIVEALGLTAELAVNTTYSALAIGNLNDGLSNDELFVVIDDVRRVATEAKLRAIHASTLAGSVDIYISADATPSNDDVILSNIPYKGDSGLLPVMPGEVYIMITPVNMPSTVAIGPVMLDLVGGSITTLVAIDDPMSPTSVGAISLDD